MKYYKRNYTENDISNITWHDNVIHGIIFNPENYQIQFEIDYQLEWIKGRNGTDIDTIACPALLIFNNVNELEMNAKWGNSYMELIINEINHINKSWIIDLGWPENAYIKFNASGFNMKLKGKPKLMNKSKIPINERK